MNQPTNSYCSHAKQTFLFLPVQYYITTMDGMEGRERRRGTEGKLDLTTFQTDITCLIPPDSFRLIALPELHTDHVHVSHLKSSDQKPQLRNLIQAMQRYAAWPVLGFC